MADDDWWDDINDAVDWVLKEYPWLRANPKAASDVKNTKMCRAIRAGKIVGRADPPAGPPDSPDWDPPGNGVSKASLAAWAEEHYSTKDDPGGHGDTPGKVIAFMKTTLEAWNPAGLFSSGYRPGPLLNATRAWAKAHGVKLPSTSSLYRWGVRGAEKVSQRSKNSKNR